MTAIPKTANKTWIMLEVNSNDDYRILGVFDENHLFDAASSLKENQRLVPFTLNEKLKDSVSEMPGEIYYDKSIQ